MPVEAALWYKPMWTLMGLLNLLMNICQADHEITVDPPWNIQIIDPGHLGQLHINWELPASLRNRTDCALRFQLQFFNTYDGDWTTIRTRQQSYSTQFDLEKNVHVRIQTILNGPCSGYREIHSPPAEVLLKPPAVGLPGTKIEGLHCIFYHREYMICTWHKGHTTPPQAKYHLYFWHREMGHAMECPEYLQYHEHRSGCRFSWHSLLEFTEFNICVNGSSAETLLQPAYFSLQLQNHVKPDVIHTLNLETLPKKAVSLKWAPPKGRIPEGCLEYEVESAPEGAKELVVRNFTRETSFTLSAKELWKSLCFRVRSRVHEFCSDQSFWSNWSHRAAYRPEDQREEGSHMTRMKVYLDSSHTSKQLPLQFLAIWSKSENAPSLSKANILAMPRTLVCGVTFRAPGMSM